MAEFTEDHRAKVAANGAEGGRPTGSLSNALRAPVYMPTPADTEAIIEHTAHAIIAGKTPQNSAPLINPISEHDRRQLARFANVSAEAFTERLAIKLRHLADLTVERIAQKLEQDKFKPHELSFLLTVGVDKLQRLEGRSALQGANVNVQINNFGPQSKADIIARLTGQTLDLPPATPSPSSSLDPAPA